MKKKNENYLIVGLGNPDDKYKNTRHNVGWMALDFISDGEDWEMVSKLNSFVIPMTFGKSEVTLIKPTTYMNKSGVAVLASMNKFKVKPKNVIVIYDDMDLGIGGRKISFNRGSGGHRGVESIIKNLKTKEFIRIRIGISPTTASGKIKKPKGEEEVLGFILKDFRPNEMSELKKVFKDVNEVIDSIVTEGLAKAMNNFN